VFSRVQEICAQESEVSASIRVLQKQQRNLDILRSYLEGLISAAEKNGILVVDPSTGIKTAISKERMSMVLSALKELNEAGIPPSTFGFSDSKVPPLVEEAVEQFSKESRAEVEDSIKPLLADIREKLKKNKEEITRLQISIAQSHQVAKDLWYLQPPDVNPSKIERHVKSLNEGHMNEVIGIPTATSFINTERHTFHGRQGTHDYTCSWTFSEMPEVIEPGASFEVIVKGKCQANRGNRMGRKMIKLEVRGRGLKVLPDHEGQTEKDVANFLEVGERHSGKTPSAQKTFRLETEELTPEKGTILRLQAVAHGWGPVVTWNWKFGEKSAEVAPESNDETSSEEKGGQSANEEEIEE
jgi:hypothetical protein